MARTKQPEVNEKPQEAAELKTPIEGQPEAVEIVASVPSENTQSAEDSREPLLDDTAEADHQGGELSSGLEEASPPAIAPRQMIRVVGPKKGIRRAGRRFGRDPVEIALDDLSEDQIAALRDDPALSVTVL